MKSGYRRLAGLGLVAVIFLCAVQRSASYLPETVTVTIEATDADAGEIGPNIGKFKVRRIGGDPSLQLVVYLQTPTGSALNGTDYQTLPTPLYVTIPAWAAAETVTITPYLDVNCSEGTEKVVLTLPDNPNYLVGDPSSAEVNIADVPANSDSDGDGMLDCWELEHFEDLDQTAGGNSDSDALTNLQEYMHGTNPNQNDTTLDANNAISLQVYTPLR